MSDGFMVRHLRCSHCGKELSARGKIVTFRCETCLKHWILTDDGLRALDVFRAEPAEPGQGEPLFLPFWTIPFDSSALACRIEGACLPEKSTSGGQLQALLRRITEREVYNVFIPAFQSANTYALLKAGRLLTSRQPRFTACRAGSDGPAVSCALQPEQAACLAETVFIAALPDSIRQNGSLLERIDLGASSPPRLVEFPFLRRGTALRCLCGDLEVSSRLIGNGSLREPSGAPHGTAV